MNKNNKLAKEEFDKETRCYFDSISLKPRLSIPVLDTFVLDSSCYVDLTPCSAIILWIYEEYELQQWIDIIFVKDTTSKKNAPNSSTELQMTVATEVPNQPSIRYRCSNNNQYISSKFREFSRVAATYTENCVNEIREPNVTNIVPLFSNFGYENSSCKRPFVLVEEKHLLIAGLSSVLRFLIKFSHMKSVPDESKVSNQHQEFQKLLGFRGGCLQACAEVSVWTKFCEVDIFDGLSEVIEKQEEILFRKPSNGFNSISKELLRLEYHLRKPVKIHNIRKEAQLKQNKKSEQELEPRNHEDSPTDACELEHEFAEGPYMLLSDLILYPCISLFYIFYGKHTFEQYLPHTLRWYLGIENSFRLNESGRLGFSVNRSQNNLNRTMSSTNLTWKMPIVPVPEESLYKSDHTRFNPTSRLFTRQCDVEEAINAFTASKIPVFNISVTSTSLNWDDIPILAHPEGGRMPEKRRLRKCQQLSSIVLEVVKVVEEKTTSASSPIRIVDFCSGGGHVGILLAWLLPKCQIILVENKEESLRRGWGRIQQLGLTNALFYQSNLDYFDGQFEVGCALHSCGTATDLVLSKCVAANASFVCCPCCYGAIHSNHMLHYPRSSVFRERNISLKHYFILAHASDQTHDAKNEKTEQGKLCMKLIDSDRCLNAQENGYKIYLTKINPETASPKNHILVGMSSSQCQELK